MKIIPANRGRTPRWHAAENCFLCGDADCARQSKKSAAYIMLFPSDASFANLQKGKTQMLIHPNHSSAYRNWAYCCAQINRLTEEFELWSAGKPRTACAYYYLQANGRAAFMEHCKQRADVFAKKISHYTKLRDKLAAELIDPEKHLLQLEDMLNMVGNVIEITPRHSKKRTFRTLSKCSPDGTKINKLDAYDLLSFGYGK